MKRTSLLFMSVAMLTCADLVQAFHGTQDDSSGTRVRGSQVGVLNVLTPQTRAVFERALPGLEQRAGLATIFRRASSQEGGAQDFEAQQRAMVASAAAHLLTHLTQDRVPYAAFLLQGVTHDGDAYDIVRLAATLPLEQLRLVQGADFFPDYRAKTLEVAQHLTQEKVRPLKALLEGVTDRGDAQGVIENGASLPYSALRAVADAGFGVHNRARVLEAVVGQEDVTFTPDRVVAIEALLENVTDFWIINELIRSGLTLSLAHVNFALETGCRPNDRTHVLTTIKGVAQHLTPEKIPFIKARLTGVTSYLDIMEIIDAAAPLPLAQLSQGAESSN
ncbi:MAG: hypothetical protein C0514_04015 [Candidatus Puniceispirillum sp.]|nr:hypothetical protein [Candidatus Puniceispirillum sp.]